MKHSYSTWCKSGIPTSEHPFCHRQCIMTVRTTLQWQLMCDRLDSTTITSFNSTPPIRMSGTHQPHRLGYCVTISIVIVVGTILFTVSTCVHAYYIVKDKIMFKRDKQRKAIGTHLKWP